MPERRTAPAALLCALPALMLAACQSETPTENPREAASTAAQALTHGAELPARYERFVSWGEDADQLKLHPPGYQDPARGPDAVAVLPTGAVLILDQLNERVVAVGTDGPPVKVADAPLDAADLVASTDGSFAAWSRVRARAWFYSPTGASLGEMEVPRSFMFLQRLSLSPERSLVLHTDNQDRIALGSAQAPIEEIPARRARRYGAAELPDGRGVFAQIDDGHAVLLVLDQPNRDRDRPAVMAKHAIPGEVKAARIVGTFQSTTCMRLEKVWSTPTIQVERRAVCMDAATGQVLLDETLPPPGLYTPRSELAMTGGRMALMHAGLEGVTITGWRVPVAGEEVQP